MAHFIPTHYDMPEIKSFHEAQRTSAPHRKSWSRVANYLSDKSRLFFDARAAFRNFVAGLKLSHYIHFTRPVLEQNLRKKDKISVFFVLSVLGMWKTENLYLTMLAHPRFSPKLVLVNSAESPDSFSKMKEYLDKKGYEYTYVDPVTPLQQHEKADIIFYQKPYGFDLHDPHSFRTNYSSLFCYAEYCVHNTITEESCNQPFHNIVWQLYYENESTAKESSQLMGNHGANIRVTGFPAFDQFSDPTETKICPWNPQPTPKKRIIYAPHFSIADASWIVYSTFLENGEFMLEMARKYADEVQFTFKPHPLLYKTLVNFWGQERTDRYYRAWEELPNGQVELGKYVGLFMNSDAMIHDCSSFTIEYMFSGKPVMFLVNDRDIHHVDDLNTFTREAYRLHYKGHSHEEIENFIRNVIADRDPLKEERKAYCDEFLKPINGRSACENIIAEILGE